MDAPSPADAADATSSPQQTVEPAAARTARLAQMMAWLHDTGPLELLRRRMPPGATLDDARRLHRLIAQEGRRFSKVMRDLTEDLP
jgi:hypothetical protein